MELRVIFVTTNEWLSICTANQFVTAADDAIPQRDPVTAIQGCGHGAASPIHQRDPVTAI